MFMARGESVGVRYFSYLHREFDRAHRQINFVRPSLFKAVTDTMLDIL